MFFVSFLKLTKAHEGANVHFLPPAGIVNKLLTTEVSAAAPALLSGAAED